jgi:hypothetical protein
MRGRSAYVSNQRGRACQNYDAMLATILFLFDNRAVFITPILNDFWQQKKTVSRAKTTLK